MDTGGQSTVLMMKFHFYLTFYRYLSLIIVYLSYFEKLSIGKNEQFKSESLLQI